MDIWEKLIRRFVPKSLRRFIPSWALVHFGFSSVACLAIDLTVFSLVCLPLEGIIGREYAIVMAVLVARLISGNCNFIYNQRFVFSVEFSIGAYVKYWLLVVFNATLLTLLTQGMTHYLDARGIRISLCKFIADIILFLFSFIVQKVLIFRRVDQFKKEADVNESSKDK